ncbi:MAG: hypothetical protein IPJ14_00805 [Kineosporiaceae bacterium]|nr:hypothetical protein [Kineosporiaceae bacterium]
MVTFNDTFGSTRIPEQGCGGVATASPPSRPPPVRTPFVDGVSFASVVSCSPGGLACGVLDSASGSPPPVSPGGLASSGGMVSGSVIRSNMTCAIELA